MKYNQRGSFLAHTALHPFSMCFPPTCSGTLQYWSVTVPSLVRHWSVTGPSLVRHWSATGPSLVRHWSVIVKRTLSPRSFVPSLKISSLIASFPLCELCFTFRVSVLAGFGPSCPSVAALLSSPLLSSNHPLYSLNTASTQRPRERSHS